MFRIRLGLIYLHLFLVSACISNPLDDFGEIFPGMDKTEVLDTMGNPQATQRFYGKDRWTYRFYDRGIHFQKEVHFFEGSVIYAGEVYQPEVSAFEQDVINAKINDDMDLVLEQEYRTPASVPASTFRFRPGNR